MSQDVFVIVEHLKGEIGDVTFELLGQGKEIAAATGGTLVALLAGSATEGWVGQLGAAGRVVSIDHASLADFNPETYVAAMVPILREQSPRLTLVANTSMGMDLAAALSVRLDWPLVAYTQKLAVEDGTIIATSQLYGGKIYAESELDGDHGIVSVLAGSFPAEAGRADGAPTVESAPPPAELDSPRLVFQGLVEPEASDVDITQYETLVCVGRGIQNQDNIAIAEELAQALGGAVCASRPVVDAKWLPKARQVGKSGLKVKPKIYITLGVSGAPEHLEGMKDAELIIAVNTDEAAPIFEHAHFGTTEDLFDVIPALTQKLT